MFKVWEQKHLGAEPNSVSWVCHLLEKIWFTLGMGENSCPQMDGFILFILEMTKARGT